VQEITEVLVRYATAIDTKQWALLETCFTTECRFTARDGALQLLGSQAVVDFMRASHTSIDGSLHRLTNITVEARPGERDAAATSYLDALIVERAHPGGPTFQLAATYRDQVVLGDAGWRIARRDVTALWSAGNPAILEATVT
jgi:3-phenylpropionate/cinnamic acid dioxygenase small subunit